MAKQREIDLSDAEEVEEVAVGEFENKEVGRITQVVYRCNKNLGNYETESVELYCSVGGSETAEEVFNDLKIMAYDMLNPDES